MTVQNAAIFVAMLQSVAHRQYLCTMDGILVPNSTGPGLFGLCFTGETEVVQEASGHEQCDSPTVFVLV